MENEREQYLAYIERLESLIVDLSAENRNLREMVVQLQYKLMNRDAEFRIMQEKLTGKKRVEMIIN